MSDSNLKLISIERVKTLLDCYGGDPAAWPEAEQSAAIALLNQSDELQRYQREAQELDGRLNSILSDDSSEVPDFLLASLMTDLPPQEQLSAKNFDGAWLYKVGGIAALLVITFSIVLMSDRPGTVEQEVAAFDQWAMAEMADDIGVVDGGELAGESDEFDLDVALLIGFYDVAL